MDDANNVHSLAWIEFNTILCKLHFTYDLEILNPELDWHKDSAMHTLWQKPEELRVRFKRRTGNTSKRDGRRGCGCNLSRSGRSGGLPCYF